MKNNIILSRNALEAEEANRENQAISDIQDYISEKTGFKTTFSIGSKYIVVGYTCGKPNYMLSLNILTAENIDSKCAAISRYFEKRK